MEQLFRNTNINFILIITMFTTVTMGMFYYKRIKDISELLNIKKNKKEKKKKVNNLLSGFKDNLYIILVLRNKENRFDLILNLFTITLFSIFILFLNLDSLFLAICIPMLIYSFTTIILKELIVDFDFIVKKNFSTLVNHMIKHFAKTNDLSIVLYESSKEIDEPLRSLILTLSREIITSNNEQRFINLIERTDNLWLHSFLLTLINYKESSSKENIINNLLELAELIDKRNELNRKMVSDRKPVVIVNYMLLLVGVVIFIGNLVVNPIMKTFLFTPMGSMSLVIGISCMFLTVIVNMKLIKG